MIKKKQELGKNSKTRNHRIAKQVQILEGKKANSEKLYHLKLFYYRDFIVGMMEGAWKLVLVMVVMEMIGIQMGRVEALSATCQSGLATLTPCVAYFQGDGSGSPSFLCCGSLSSLLASQPQCFCQVLDSLPDINSTVVLQAFSACAISLPNDIQACITGGGTGMVPIHLILTEFFFLLSR